ncbi:putative ribonuclease H-like domain-containing protein [Tanacetum coccineum]
MIPRTVLMKSGLVSVNIAREVNAAHSKITVNAVRRVSYLSKTAHSTGNPQMDLQDQRVIDSACSRYMTGNMSYLIDYEEIDRGYVAFGGNPKGGKITRKCTIKTGTQSNGFAGTKASDNAGRKESECNDQEKEDNVNNTNNVNVAGTNEIIAYLLSRDDEDDGAMADMNNLDTTIQINPNPTTRIHKDHPLDQVIGDLQSATQTRKMSKNLEEHGFEEPKKVIHALKDPSWIEAMQEELLQFKNKKDERGIVIRNKARLVAQGYTQEEGIDYDEKKCFFSIGKIEEEVYVCQPLGFEDSDFPDRVYKVEKALYRLHQAPRAWYETLPTYLLDNGFQRGKIDNTLFIKMYKGDILLVQVYIQQKKDGIFISQDKYVDEILKKFRFTEVKTASTPMETQKPLLKDEDGEEVDVHMYRSMIGSLMYLTSSRPDIMFAVCACARYQVNPKVSHLHAVKRIFRYLKGQPKLGLWYPKDSPFDLVAYTDSDYAGASLDRKSTIGEKAKKSVRLMMKKLVISKNRQSDLVSNRIERVERELNILKTDRVFGLELELMLVKTVNGEVQLQAIVDGKKIIITESTTQKPMGPKKKDTQVPQSSVPSDNVADDAVYKELDDSLVRAATTASSLEAEQDSGSII